MRRIRSTLLLSLLPFVAPAGTAAANLIQNGSFEAGNYTLDGNQLDSLQPGSTAITGWTVISGELVVGRNDNPFVGAAEDGNYHLDLTGYHDAVPYGGVEQTVATVPDRRYAMKFYIGAYNSKPLYRAPVSITANAGSVSGDFTNNSTAAGQVWEPFALHFTAAGASTVVSLVGKSTAGGQYIGLDNVSLVPELAGDANDDGTVNFTDLLTLAENYGARGAAWEQGDFTGDGSVSFDDLLLLARNYGQTLMAAQMAQLSPAFAADVRSAFAQVPEPALTGAAFAGIALVRRRRV